MLKGADGVDEQHQIRIKVKENLKVERKRKKNKGMWSDAVGNLHVVPTGNTHVAKSPLA